VIDERVFMGGNHAAELQPIEVYRSRRRRVQALLPAGGVAVVLGASDDRGYGDVGTFRQESNFFYLTGVELPNAALIMTPDSESLVLPARRPALEAWTGPKFGPGPDAAAALGFEEVVDRDGGEIVVDARRRPQPSFSDRVAGLLGTGATLWVLLPGAASGELTPEQELARMLRDRLASFAVRDLAGIVTEMRLVKDEGEIALLTKAVAATMVAQRAAASTVGAGVREGALDGAAFAALRSAGAEGWSFPPIVGAGKAGCILHYDANLGVLADGELVVVDIGARHGYYCGDLTRTLPVSGQFSPRQRELYAAVLEAYDAAVATLRPGSTIAAARQAAFAALEAARPRGDDGRTLGQFFIHGLGHFLGLDAHDAGGEAPSLVPGMVVTVEPGIYLPGEGIGIRVEDDYLITASGAVNLSRELPRDIAGVEALAAPR